MKFQINNLFGTLIAKKKTSKKRKSVSRNRAIFDFENTKKKIKKKHRSSHISHISALYKIKHKALILIMFIVICVGSFLYFTPLFRVSEIHIESNLNTININRAYENTSYLRGKHIFGVKSSEIIERIQSGQKSIRNVSVQASFPSKISIFLESHDIILQTDSSVVLSNGLIVDKTHSIENIPTILIGKHEENSIVLSENTIQKVPIIISEIEKNLPSRGIASVYLTPPEKELLIKDTLGTIFIFDLTQNIGEQIKKLSVYQTENNEVLIGNEDYYRDLRIAGKIFICKKSDAAICTRNLNAIYNFNNLSNFLDAFES